MAGICRGFAFEQDVSAALTIEGNEIEGFDPTDDPVSALLPTGEKIEAASVEELVERYLDKTGALARREAAKVEHLRKLREGRKAWNRWRLDHPEIQPMLACLNASKELQDTQLDGYDFSYSNLCQAQLQGVSLKRCNFHQANLADADLSGARLQGANFCRTDLYMTNFEGARMRGANLQGVQLARTDLTGADLRDCKVYGMSTWDIKLVGTEQENLIIKYQARGDRGEEEELTVDSLDMAAFLYSTLNNRNIRRLIETANRKWVLILGNFREERQVLDEVASALKQGDCIPIIFDFVRPDQRDLIETILLLAGMSSFVIADITNTRSTPAELQAIATSYSVPIVPILKKGAKPFATFAALRTNDCVLKPLTYESTDDLLARLSDEVVEPARRTARRLADKKRAADTPET